MSENNGKEIRLDALVSKLHSEGVSKGKAEAEQIVAKAKEEAAAIIRKATQEAEATTKAANAKAEEFQENAVASVRLAARDTMLALNRSVRDLYEKAFKTKVGAVLDDPEFLKGLIVSLAEEWAQGKDVAVGARPDVGEKLLALAQSGMEGMLAEGIEIRLNRSITNGFRIRLEDGQVAYDFSDDSVVESLKLHLSPQLAELLEL